MGVVKNENCNHCINKYILKGGLRISLNLIF